MGQVMAHIVFERIVKSYGGGRVLDDVSLAIAAGEFMTLLGPSGCGKTTLLRTLAGFVEPDAGRVLVGGRDVTYEAPNRRNVGYVFQNYALFPHLTVAGNVAYGLKVRRAGRAEIRERTERALELVALRPWRDSFPAQLSGGQQQRVALARVLVLEPEVLLLDEPFNALDAKLRLAMQIELRRLIERVGITSIFVTHDQAEAMTLSDRVAVMSVGRIEQVGRPLEIYDRPASSYVASFIGRANVVAVAIRGGAIAEVPGLSAPRADGAATLIVRPENLALAPSGAAGWSGTVGFVAALGPHWEIEVDIGAAQPVRVAVPRRAGENGMATGQPATVAVIDPAACVVLAREAGGGA
jgi:ABC-type Fe3+/spermidine/putrescine transport system ATPase subunit